MTIKGCESFRVSREFRASYIARFLLCPQLSRNLPRYRCKVSSPRVKNSPRNFLAAFSFDFDRLAAPRHCAAKFQREGRILRDRVTKWIRKGVRRGLEDRMEASKAAEFIQETMVAIRSREGTSFICQMLLKRRFPSENVSGNKALTRDWIACASVPPLREGVCDPWNR